MEPRTLFEDPEVRLADQELVVSGWHYALSDIESAEVFRQPTAATGPILMIVIGLLSLLAATGEAGASAALLGAASIAGAAIWWTQKKPTFQIILRTSAGEPTPFESRDEQLATRVLQAINEARTSAGATSP